MIEAQGTAQKLPNWAWHQLLQFIEKVGSIWVPRLTLHASFVQEIT